METLVKADIFFFVTTIAVVVVSIFLAIALWHFIRTLRDTQDLSLKVKEDMGEAGEYIEEVAERITESSLFTFLFPKKRRKKKEH